MYLESQAQPRGLRHYENASSRVLSGLLLMGALTLWLLWDSHSLFVGWAELFKGLSTWFGVPSQVALSWGTEVDVTVTAAVPQVAYLDGAVGVGLAAGLAAGASWLVAPANVPARYMLRALALVLALPLGGLLLPAAGHTLDLEAHLAQGFALGFWFLMATPMMFAATCYVLPGNVLARTWWVLLCVLYLYLTVPVLAMLHLYVLAVFGGAWAPLMSVLLSVLVLSFEFIAFYGLAASVEE